MILYTFAYTCTHIVCVCVCVCVCVHALPRSRSQCLPAPRLSPGSFCLAWPLLVQEVEHVDPGG